jgi:hypothetical protein
MELYTSNQSTITVLPFLHGSLSFSRQVRECCLAQSYDCIAVDLPEPFGPYLSEAIDDLPIISAIIAREQNNTGPAYYVPVDPCDAAIEAVRQARQNHKPFFCIGPPDIHTQSPLPPLPDDYAIAKIGFNAFASLCLRVVGDPSPGSGANNDCQYIAYSLHRLRQRFNRILAFVHMRHFSGTIRHFLREKTHNLLFPDMPRYSILRECINPDHLYFVLGELPFITGKCEKNRYEAFSFAVDPLACIKDLFRETRDHYNEGPEEVLELSPARIQRGLQFLRNLTLNDSRLIPELIDIVIAAKGIGGNSYAVHILSCARYYPFLPPDPNTPLLSVGIDKIMLPGESAALDAINCLRDFAVSWKSLSIKPEPTIRRKKKYRFSWDPNGMCSHTPEDVRIENFNSNLREKAALRACEDRLSSEKFTVSMRDGLDIRETLMNWQSGDLYVKNVPMERGRIDTVVIIFDADHDERYPHQATWYAEHNEESTLSFYSTDPFETMIGPGIARSYYGGLSLLFPPRSIPNIFEMELDGPPMTHAERLTFGALLFSDERLVGFLSKKRPTPSLVKIASRFKKRLVWLPLSSYSAETLKRLRTFHVLNGKEVRSWATRFIGE